MLRSMCAHAQALIAGCGLHVQGNAEKALALLVGRPHNTICKDKTPRTSIKLMQQRMESHEKREAYLVEAKVDAVLASCAKSLPSVRSGVMCYVAFVDWIKPGTRSYLPPTVELLQAWSTAFRPLLCVGLCSHI